MDIERSPSVCLKHGMVALNAEGRVIRPAICGMTSVRVKLLLQLKLPFRQELIGRTGNPMTTGFQLPKLVWFAN